MAISTLRRLIREELDRIVLVEGWKDPAEEEAAYLKADLEAGGAELLEKIVPGAEFKRPRSEYRVKIVAVKGDGTVDYDLLYFDHGEMDDVALRNRMPIKELGLYEELGDYVPGPSVDKFELAQQLYDFTNPQVYGGLPGQRFRE